MKPIKSFTLDQIKSTVISKGYKWFENGDFNLNLNRNPQQRYRRYRYQ
jgi:hypothetical protein